MSSYYRQSDVLEKIRKVKPVILELPPAHPKQYELINSFESHPGLRFIVGACGTKFGKTMGCCIRLVQEAWANKGTLNWWIAPSYAQATNAYNLVMHLLPKDSFKEFKAELRIRIIEPDGSERSTIEFKSGDNPDTLRGFGVHFFVMDEAARISYDSFVSVMTTVTQTRGRGIIISTPKGRGWFYDVYQRGEKTYDDGTSKFINGDVDKNPEWLSIRMPSWSNPWVAVEAILELKNNLPEDAFRQEVAAHFLMDSAGVFKGVSHCIKGNLEPSLPGHSYVMGVDLARLQDYTVLCVMDRHRGHVVHFDRLNQTSWEVIYNRVIETARRYHATVVSDWTGIGDPILETLKGAGGLHFEPYKIGSSTAKQQLIDKLRVNIEQQKVSFPASLNVLRKELESYEYKMTEAGRVQFSAPTGFHDDAVIALALANWGADKEQFMYKFSNVRL